MLFGEEKGSDFFVYSISFFIKSVLFEIYRKILSKKRSVVTKVVDFGLGGFDFDYFCKLLKEIKVVFLVNIIVKSEFMDRFSCRVDTFVELMCVEVILDIFKMILLVFREGSDRFSFVSSFFYFLNVFFRFDGDSSFVDSDDSIE